MFFTANYISPAQYKHNIDQYVSVICHLLKPGQDCKKLRLCPPLTMSEASHSNDSGNSIIIVFENMLENSTGIISIFLQYAKVGMREQAECLVRHLVTFTKRPSRSCHPLCGRQWSTNGLESNDGAASNCCSIRLLQGELLLQLVSQAQ